MMRCPPRTHRQRDAEIRDERLPFVQQNVFRLDVAVNHALAVRVVERAGHGFGKMPRALLERQLDCRA